MAVKKTVKVEGALVIVESPAKAKTINKILGSEYVVKASMGHVRDLPGSEFGVDVDHGFKPLYKILPSRKKTVTELKKVAEKSGDIYLAPDPDREGEAIAWHLASILEDTSKPIRRVTFNEITKNAVLAAFKHPREIDMHKVDSQQARRILDRIVGYKISPLLWRKVGKGLSAGRVQSVAVKLICEREEEIRRFVPKEYWTLDALMRRQEPPSNDFSARMDRINGEKAEVSDGETAARIAAEIESLKETLVVVGVQSKDRTQKAPTPFITSQLQQAGVNTLRYSVQKTMKIAQELYEGVELGSEGSVGLITYMRTDSFHISDEAKIEAKDYIQGRYGAEYVPETYNVFKSKKGAQEAHEAIRPTYVQKDPDSIRQYLSSDQYKVYTLIWKRFLQSQMSAARLKVHSVEIAAGAPESGSLDAQNATYIFRAAGTQVIFPGYLVLEEPAPKDEDSENADNSDKEAQESGRDVLLPEMAVGDKIALVDLKTAQHFTKPPPRYTEASLVKALEEREIGRPSTYAPIIQTILKREYVHKDRGKLIPTELGFTVTGLLNEHFPEVMDIEFTAQMEANLDLIEDGSQNWQSLLKDFYEPFVHTLDNASKNMKTVKRDPIPTGEVCEKCGSVMVIRTGRYGKFVACSGYPKCKNVKPLDTGISCPKAGCTGKVVQRKSKKGKFFYGCTRYPECDFTASNLKQFENATGSAGSAETTPQGQSQETET